MLVESHQAEPLQAEAPEDADVSRGDDADVTPDEPGVEVAASAPAEEQELAAALAAILARKPRRPSHPSPATPSTAADDESVPDAPTVRRPFVSALRHQASPLPAPTTPFADEEEVDDPGSDTVPRDSASWLAETRRRTVRRKLKAAGAWVATVALGCVIVIVAAAILFEGPRDLEAWIDLARRTL